VTRTRVAAVVVAFGPPEPCLACLESLRASEGVDCRAWVVDHNADPSGEVRVSIERTGGRYVHEPGNRGYAAGVNLGFRDALRSGEWDLLMALNADVRVAPSCLRELLRVFGSDPRIGLAGPGLLCEGEPARWWNLGSDVEWPGARPRSLHHGEPAVVGDAAPRDVGFVAGAALAVSPELFARVGPLDEGYFLYFEDAEYSFRARSAGFRTVVCPAALAWHSGGGSTAGLGARDAYWRTRSRLRFSRRWNPHPLRGALSRASFVARQILRALFCLTAREEAPATWACRGALDYVFPTRAEAEH